MSSQDVAHLLTELDTLLRPVRTTTVSGHLTDWRAHRSGLVTATLHGDDSRRARIRVVARRHAASAAADELADAGRTPATAGLVTVHGHVAIDVRWGLELTLFRLTCLEDRNTPHKPASDHPNRRHLWPARIHTIGLVAPDGSDDAYADVVAVCTPVELAIAEQRVTVTGPRAALIIGQALDRLALDPRPDVTLLVRGGGPSVDFAPFNSRLVIAAIGRHPRPVITGLGHASDHSAADAAAHTSCITPTAAAQLAATSDPHHPAAHTPGPRLPPSPPR